MKYIKIFLVFVLLLFSVGVYAQPPFPETQSLDTTLTLETIQYNKHPINTEYYLHTHVHGSINGLIKDPVLNNISCYYHLYSENENWDHVSVGTLSPYFVGMQTRINETYFNETGSYAIMMWCECDGCLSDIPDKRVGGFVRYFFSVYDDTQQSLEVNEFYFHLIVLIVIISLFVISLYARLGILGILTSVGVLIYSALLFGVSIWIGIITFSSGLLLMLYFLLLQEQD